MTHLLYTHLFLRHAQGDRDVKTSGICTPILLGPHSHMAQNLAQSREKQNTERADLKWMDSPSDNYLKYGVHSSFLSSLTWA